MRFWITALCFASMLHGAKELEIYFVDVEGGQATLLVSPSGESLLVDAGWPGFAGRDADRIVAAAKLAGVKQIDYLVVTHYHTDHVGGVPQLAAKIPVIHYVDHGANLESSKNAEALFQSYLPVRAQGKHLHVKPGSRIPIRGLDVVVVAAAGQTITRPVKSGGAPNPRCAARTAKAADTSENGRSVGMMVSYGSFRFLNLGDLTWNLENALVCPRNLLGRADLYLTTHHGMNLSGPETLVHAVRPRVAVMNNGAKKGGAAEAWRVVRNSPGLQDLWQLHYSLPGGPDHNVDEQMIANLEENCQGHWIKVAARRNGEMTVTNGRNNFSKTYRP